MSIDVGKVKNWDEIEALVHESYRLIASKKTVAKWQAERAPGPKRRSKSVRRQA